MERLLLLWDELDDLVCACRHIAASAVEEVGAVSSQLMASVAATFTAFAMWLIRQ